jgi:hypothetical protein
MIFDQCLNFRANRIRFRLETILHFHHKMLIFCIR